MMMSFKAPALTFLVSGLWGVMTGCTGERLVPSTPWETGGTTGAEVSRGARPPTGAGGAAGGPSALGPAQHRVVAIGDLHSDIGSARKAFQLAGAIDDQDAWVGGELAVVQLGDMIGRSDDERQVLDFLFDVRQKAEAGGGRVYLLVGNHEVMGGRVDNQAIGLNPFPGYEDLLGLNLADPRLLILPDSQRRRGAALMAGGIYAKRFAQLPTVLQLGKTVFVHGGVVPRWAQYGLERINAEVSHWFFGDSPEPDSSRS